MPPADQISGLEQSCMQYSKHNTSTTSWGSSTGTGTSRQWPHLSRYLPHTSVTHTRHSPTPGKDGRLSWPWQLVAHPGIPVPAGLDTK